MSISCKTCIDISVDTINQLRDIVSELGKTDVSYVF